MFIAGLREFTGKVPVAYSDQKEFFINSLRRMSEHLLDLKKATLEEASETFTGKLGRGLVTAETLAEFKELLDKTVSAGDFALIIGSMIGSPELIRKRLAALAPFSLVEEEKKTRGRDPEAERHIGNAYARMNFAPLVKELGASPDDRTLDAVLSKARAEVAEYCCLYHIPLDSGDTFTPFSLLHVDAALAATYRLLSDIRKRMYLKGPGERSVLIVDDDEAIIELLEFLVRKEGFRVEKAVDGEEALKKAKALHPDLILLDMMLPKYGGYEILRELQDGDTSDIPIVIITGRSSDRSTVEMLKRESNIKDLLEKPVKQHVLTALLHSLLEKRAK